MTKVIDFKTSRVENKDYKFRDDLKDQFGTTGIEILTGPSKGIIFHLGTSKIIKVDAVNENELMPNIELTYNIDYEHSIKLDKDYDENNEELQSVIGDIFVSILKSELNERRTNNNTESNSE